MIEQKTEENPRFFIFIHSIVRIITQWFCYTDVTTNEEDMTMFRIFMMILGAIFYFPIGVILALAKNYR